MARGEYLYNIGSMPKGTGQSSAIPNVLRNLPTSTPSPGFQSAIQNIEAYRRRNPVRIPFAAGTPTQRRREMTQEGEQFKQSYELDLRQQEEIERHNRAVEALNRARENRLGNNAPKPNKVAATNDLFSIFSAAKQQGRKFDEVLNEISVSPKEFTDGGLTYNDAIDIASNAYYGVDFEEAAKRGLVPGYEYLKEAEDSWESLLPGFSPENNEGQKAPSAGGSGALKDIFDKNKKAFTNSPTYVYPQAGWWNK